MYKLTIAGGGPGNENYFLPEAKAAVNAAGYVFADKRYLHLVKHERVEAFSAVFDTAAQIKHKLDLCDVTVIVSGDPLFFSLTKTLKKYIPEARVTIIPGIGSLQYLAAKAGRITEDAIFFSAHGREPDMDRLMAEIRTHSGVYLLCDNTHTPDWIAGKLVENGLGALKMCAGSHLSYETERLITGDAAELAKMTFDNLCVVAVFNDCMVPPFDHAYDKPGALFCDTDFERDKVPMTREEVRWAILGKLHLKPDAVLWDIGAGTGSVTMECARYLLPGGGQVFAIERNPGAVELIHRNKNKFGLKNVTVVHGDAKECIKELPMPDCVFIGGSGRELPELLEYIKSLNKKIRTVTACVTMETIALALNAYEQGWEDTDMIQINIGRGKVLGSYHVIENSHPVTLFSGSTSYKKEIL